MDLGISGRTAIVCGASAGLGRGAATALAREGVTVFAVARNAERLDLSTREIVASTGGVVHAVSADVTTEEGRGAVLTACPEPDILVNNAGGPPAGDFRSWSRADWIAALDANMLSAIFLTNAVIDAMIARRFGRIVNITSHMVKQPAAFLSLSNGARSGLTGFVGGVARDVARHNVTMNNVLPGQFDTGRLNANHARIAERSGRDAGAVRESALRQIPANRFGDPQEFGEICAFLCSVQAGFVTGQNILADGGQFPGLL